jgi:plastocyanin
MKYNRRFVIAALAVGAVSAAPAAAGAAVTRDVYAGPAPAVNKVVKKLGVGPKLKPFNPNINAFFNQRTTINVGDTVSFHLNGFHTVDLPGKSTADLPLIVAGKTVTGANDAAGSPFWFDGKVPSLGLNPQLFGRSKSKTYNGTARVDSGAASSKPFNVQFTKPGVYKFFCDVHPGMIGYVVVKPQGKAIPSSKQAAAATVKQATADIKAAAVLLKIKQPADTVSLGESTPSGVELYSMFPASLTVNAGTSVTFQMSAHSRETHTAAFGPVSDLKKLAKTFQGASFSPIGTYPSGPTQPLSLGPTSHGNGFVNTGALDRDPSTKTIGPSSRIDFTTPGTYHFVCLIHPFMQGTIIVK